MVRIGIAGLGFMGMMPCRTFLFSNFDLVFRLPVDAASNYDTISENICEQISSSLGTFVFLGNDKRWPPAKAK